VAKANDGFWKDQFNRQDLVSGVSFGAGILTPAGPIMLELMGGSRHALITYLRLGRNF
jgi:outer membrane translocation and assembly module TamA